MVFDIGEQDGNSFIAMEHLEGVTLKNLIAGRPLAMEKALSIAIGNRRCSRCGAHESKGLVAWVPHRYGSGRDRRNYLRAGMKQCSRFVLFVDSFCSPTP
jgi:hypothetical protein